MAHEPHTPTPRTLALTALALVAFAGNSLLCRLALAAGEVDPVTFTTVRLASGALALAPFLRGAPRGGWSPAAALTLVVYAYAFSSAYVTLGASTGALLLFGAVQVTMVGRGLAGGERPSRAQLAGFGVALTGFAVQVLPGLAAPDTVGAVLMTIAGVAWGVYSLRGRGAGPPRVTNARNFTLASGLALAVQTLATVAGAGSSHWTGRGLALAATSGAITSGLGYVLWYAALGGHSATSAALVQLAVPPLAALGGVLLLGEHLTLRFGAASVLTLGGIALAVLSRRPPAGAR